MPRKYRRRNPWTTPLSVVKAELPPDDYAAPVNSPRRRDLSLRFITYNVPLDDDSFNAIHLDLLQQGLQYLVELFDTYGMWWPRICVLHQIADDLPRYSEDQLYYLVREMGTSASTHDPRLSKIQSEYLQAFRRCIMAVGSMLYRPFSSTELDAYSAILLAAATIRGDSKLVDAELFQVYRRVLTTD